jgi:hypothetical protein
MLLKSLTSLLLVALTLTGCGGGSSTDSKESSIQTTAGVAAAAQADLASEDAALPPVDTTTYTTTTSASDESATVDSTDAVDATADAQQPRIHALSTASTPSSGNLTYTFDAAFTTLSTGWSINWWGSAPPNFSAARETRPSYVYAGTASQRYRLNSVASNGAADLIYSYSFAKNTSYSVSLYVRSDVNTQVRFQFRRNASPYTVVSQQTVTVGPTWQVVTLQGVYAWDDPGSVRVTPLTYGTDLYLDQMTITNRDITAQAPGGINLPAQGGSATSMTTVQTVDMEGTYKTFAPGMYFNAFNGTSQGTFVASNETRADHVHGGKSSQLFQVTDKKGGDVQLISSYPFVKGQIYHSTIYLRADVATPVQVFLRVDSAPYQVIATQAITLNTTWQKIDLEGTYVGSSSGSLRVALLNPTGTIWADDLTISTVAKNTMAPWSTAPIPNTLFGMTVSKLGTTYNWPGLGTQILRLWDTGTTWANLEPTKGAWNFTRLDMYVSYMRTNAPNGNILYTLGQTPTWASSTPTISSSYGMGAGGPPTNMADWSNYVTTLATRYKGKIQYWELWNEPDQRTMYTGNAAQLVQLATVARQALLAVDPNNKLVGPAFTVAGMSVMNSFLSSGGGPLIDIVGWHWYYSTNPESIGLDIDNLRGLMKTYGIDNKPIWNTEGAFQCDPSVMNCSTAKPTLDQSQSVNARAMFIMATKGIQNFNYHLWESTDAFGQLVLSDYVTQTPAGVAFGEARNWLEGASLTDGYTVNGQVYAFQLKKGAANFVVLWSTQANTLVNLPTAWSVNTVRTIAGAESPIPANRQLTLGLQPILLKQ